MAAYQTRTYTRTISGDGIATSLTIDFAKEITSDVVLPIIPTLITVVSGNSNGLSSTSISGTIVTFNFSGTIDTVTYIQTTLGF